MMGDKRDSLGTSRNAPVWLAAGGYLLAAVALTAAVWADPLHRPIGVLADRDKFIGFLAWFPFAVTHGQNPLHMSWIDLPNGINLMWETAMPAAAVVMWPVRAAFGTVATYNVALLVSLTLDGACTFSWLRRHTRHDTPAFLGGLLMVAGPYAATRTLGHLNLLMFFTVPLLFILLEDVVGDPGRRRRRRGVALGALAGLQVLLAEEPLALGVVTLAIACVAATVVSPRAALRRAASMRVTAAFACAAFVLVAGPALAYQFWGPYAIHGVIQPPGYVTDLLNLVSPTRATAISLGLPRATTGSPWTGSPVEWDGYVGVPLLGLALFTVLRWRRERWLAVVGVTTLAVAVLSLGPALQVDGTVTTVPLPAALLSRLPVLDNILPNRFSLPMDLGLAAILAVFVDRTLSTTGRWRAVGGAVAVAVAASLWPAAVPAAAVSVPTYFEPGGHVARLPLETAVLVFPVPYAGPTNQADASVWQAVADFGFKMFSAQSLSTGPNGHVASGSTAEPLTCVTRALQNTGSAMACRAPISAVAAQLHRLGIHVVILGPGTSHPGQVAAYVAELAGTKPLTDEGVQTWTLPG